MHFNDPVIKVLDHPLRMWSLKHFHLYTCSDDTSSGMVHLLALRLKQIESNSSITTIYDQNGSLVCEQKEINQAFQEY